MVYEISVRKHFDAAHFLRGYKGKCENLHGHRYDVVVRLKVKELDEIGLAYDFAELKQHLKDILVRFDHTCLNDIPPFSEINPSSENIASTIYKELKVRLKEMPVFSVQVWESPDSWVTYFPEG